MSVTASCNCAEARDGARCIMSESTSSPLAILFSSCSIDDINVLIGRNGDSCLFNSPSLSVATPQCGNGIREGDEVCDCGGTQECTDPCCNPATCQLADGAQCSLGACCDSQCNLRAYGTECRASTVECDIAEYCIGDSNECPQDDHILDGTPCDSNTGYCFEGACPSQADQCMSAFGK